MLKYLGFNKDKEEESKSEEPASENVANEGEKLEDSGKNGDKVEESVLPDASNGSVAETESVDSSIRRLFFGILFR